jgi:L-ascorbate metabolism protein UlaG (beta-lactamase superfamily)
MILFSVLAAPLFAQERRPSHCIAIAQSAPGLSYVHKASWSAPVGEYSVRIRYVAHATFLLQTHEGLSMATDFTGFLGNVDFLPDVVTMNNAHSTHWTAFPDPAIAHVLRGWGDAGGAADHHLELGDVLIRNVTTDIRGWDDGSVPHGNSIFIFEAAGLCIGHLGHLHHVPTDEQFAAIGRLDVVMAPVDGGYTMPLEDMIAVLQRLKSRIVIPMHWFADGSLGRFLAGMEDSFAVVDTGQSSLDVSLRNLPDDPTIMLLRPAWLRDTE